MFRSSCGLHKGKASKSSIVRRACPTGLWKAQDFHFSYFACCISLERGSNKNGCACFWPLILSAVPLRFCKIQNWIFNRFIWKKNLTVCKAQNHDVPRMYGTATSASPKCSECMPQQSLQVRCAQNVCHSNMCKSDVPRMNATTIFASPKCPDCMPLQHLQIRCAQNACRSNICKWMYATATFANFICSIVSIGLLSGDSCFGRSVK